MEMSQNWLDLVSRIWKFKDKNFKDTGTDINRSMFQGDQALGVAMTSIQTFSEERSLEVTWWPDLEWPGSEISHNMYGKDVWPGIVYTKNGGAQRRRFLNIREKAEGA